jgi:hypothetical protein
MLRRALDFRAGSCDIYRAAAKAKWIGTVEAADADAAIREAAKLYNIEDTKKLLEAAVEAGRMKLTHEFEELSPKSGLKISTWMLPGSGSRPWNMAGSIPMRCPRRSG